MEKRQEHWTERSAREAQAEKAQREAMERRWAAEDKARPNELDKYAEEGGAS